MLADHKKRAVVVMVLSYFSAFISFAATLIIARELGAEAFGIMTLALAVGAFLAPAINLGTDKMFVAMYMRLPSHAEKQQLVSNNLRIKCCTVAVMVLLTLLGCALYATPSNYLGHVTLIIWVALLGFYPMVWFDAIGKTSTQNALNLWERAAVFVFALSLMVTPDGWVSAGWVGSVLLTIRCLSIWQQHMIWSRMTGHFVWPIFKRIHAFKEQGISLAVTGAALLSVTVSYFSQLILSREVSTYEFAAYGIAFLMVNMVILFQSQLVRILLRSIARDWDNLDSVKHKVFKNSALSLLASALLALIAWLGMRLLPFILNDVRYESINDYSLYLCAWTLVVGVGQIMTQYAITGGRQKSYFSVSLYGALATIAIGFLLIPTGGTKAASLILLLVQIGMSVAVGWILRAEIHKKQQAVAIKPT